MYKDKCERTVPMMDAGCEQSNAESVIDQKCKQLSSIIQDNEIMVRRVLEILSCPKVEKEPEPDSDERYPTLPNVLELLSRKLGRTNERLDNLIQELNSQVGQIKILG